MLELAIRNEMLFTHLMIKKTSTKISIDLRRKLINVNVFSEYSPIYESINFDASLGAAIAKEAQRIKALQRQDAIECTEQTLSANRKPTNERDVQEFLDRCIPPPPATLPPPSNDTDSDADQESVQISEHTLEKLNSLYSLYKVRRSDSNDTDDSEDVVVRLRKFNNCSARSFRGSSKAMCSFAMVL